MTVSASSRAPAPFAGDGSTTSFSFTLKTYAATDFVLYKVSTAGSVTTLTLNDHYTVTLNANQETSPGGTITYPRAGSAYSVLATGEKIYWKGVLTSQQQTDLANGGAFNADNVEAALDKLTIQVQELQARVDRSIRFPVADGLLPSLPVKASRKSTGLGFDATGQLTTIASTVLSGALSGDASQIAYTPAGASAVGSTAQNKLRERVSTADFGVPDDGTTSATTAFQAFVDYVTANGKEGYVAPGSFLLDGGVDLPTPTWDGGRLVGADPAKSILIGDGSNAIFRIGGGRFEYSNLQFRNGNAGAPRSGFGIFGVLSRCLVQRCIFTNFSRGIQFNGGGFSTIRGCYFTDNGTGFYSRVGSAGDASLASGLTNVMLFEQNYFDTNALCADLQCMVSVTFLNNSFEYGDSPNTALYLRNCRNVTLINNWWEDNPATMTAIDCDALCTGSLHQFFGTNVPYPTLNGNWARLNADVIGTPQMLLGGASGALVFKPGAGSPEGVVTAQPGSLYLRTDGGTGTSLYVKESGTGNTGWAAK